MMTACVPGRQLAAGEGSSMMRASGCRTGSKTKDSRLKISLRLTKVKRTSKETPDAHVSTIPEALATTLSTPGRALSLVGWPSISSTPPLIQPFLSTSAIVIMGMLLLSALGCALIAAPFASAVPRKPRAESERPPVSSGGITNDTSVATNRTFDYVICGGGYVKYSPSEFRED